MRKSVLYRFLYLLYPKRCALCGEVIALDENLCDECRRTKHISGDICEKCGREKHHCMCKKQKFSPSYKAFCAPYYFDGSMMNGVYRLKNSGFYELAPAMAEEIVLTVQQRLKDASFDYVCSVPMRRFRQRQRGYNQSELLAKEVAQLLQIPYAAPLVKIKNTKSQRLSGARERRVNLYGVFDVKQGADVENKTFLIVDDVKTTGSTLSECAATLRGNGAKAVYAAAFTVTDKK